MAVYPDQASSQDDIVVCSPFWNAPNDFKVRLFSENLKIEDWESISWTKHDKPYYLEGHDIMCTLKFIMASIFHKLTWFSINLDVDTQARRKTLLFQNPLIQISPFFPWQIPNCTRIIWIRIYIFNFFQHPFFARLLGILPLSVHCVQRAEIWRVNT